VFSIATAVGVLLDRSRDRPPSGEPDPRLLGAWVRDSDGGRLELHSDGTAAYIAIQTTRYRIDGGEMGEPVRTEVTSTGQYRPAGPGALKMVFDEYPVWTSLRYTIDGEQLTLIRDDGGVDRYTRAR
jgi:hypothetical protein